MAAFRYRQETVKLVVMKSNLLLTLTSNDALDGQIVSGHASGALGALGVLGTSGAGKSTLLKTMAGLIGASSNQFTLFDYSWSNSEDTNPCVYVNQTLGLFSQWSVADNLQKTAKHSKLYQNNTANVCTVSDIVDDLKLNSLLHKPVELLSGGETQRVLIARAMLSSKPILLLDEILTGLDFSMRQYVMALLQKWQTQYNRCYVVVSHHLADLSFLCNQALIVNEGKISHHSSMQTALCEYESNPEAYFSKLNVKYVKTESELGVHLFTTQINKQPIYTRMKSSDMVPAHKVTQVIIPASQVSITVDTDINISTLNKLSGTIISIQKIDTHALVNIDIDKQIIQSVISQKSLINMRLKPAQNIAVLFKAI